MRVRLLTILLVAAAWLLLVGSAFAQTATPASRFAFDQTAPDLATANSYTYRYYADGATTGVALTVTCTGTASPFLCTAPVPAFTPGQHSVTLTAANIAGESPKSAPFAFTMMILPAVPANIRIQ
jgi:hypothetical protein